MAVAVAVAVAAVLALALITGAGRATGGFTLVAVIAGFGLAGLVSGLWYLVDTHLARPVDVLSGAMRARAHGDMADVLDPAVAPQLGDLAPAAAALAQGLATTRAALAGAVAQQTAQLTAGKARLEALLADVPVGVLLCSGDHKLAFYNGPAVEMIGAGLTDPGLDRPLFDFLRDGPVRLAHARLLATGDPAAASDLLAATCDGGRILSARMRLRPEGGYVLTLTDVTEGLATHAKREALMADMVDQMRRPAATLASLMAALPEAGALAPPVERALRDEVARLTRSVTELTQRHDAGRSEAVPQTATRASDLADGIRARIEADGQSLTANTTELLLQCNGFEVIALVAGLAGHVGSEAGAFTLNVVEDGPGAMIRLGWQGPPVQVAQLEGWLDAPLEPGLPDLARRDVLTGHATDLWPETTPDGPSLCLPIRQARRAVTRPTPVPRPVVYDFDLLSQARTGALHDSPLSALTYVVFDTETTGLDPARDDIVQIAAVRIVNGRRVEGEVFDTLVNPGRPIPARSTAVHGITEAMVAGAPDIAAVTRRFHAFARGAVLVAHNAPFDMALLRRAEAATGLVFDHPVLDTVLLSAVVFGQHQTHTLDELTQRLAVTIPEEARHTALGDSIATADAFLKLIGMAQGQGHGTFGAVLAQVRRHGRLLQDLN